MSTSPSSISDDFERNASSSTTAEKISFDPQRHPHLDHGYAVTSYSSHRQTADRVLINVDTELGAKDMLGNRMTYVSVSRERWTSRHTT
jgi:hypothetical protein